MLPDCGITKVGENLRDTCRKGNVTLASRCFKCNEATLNMAINVYIYTIYLIFDTVSV